MELQPAHLKELEAAGIIPQATPTAQLFIFAKICTDKRLSPFSKQIHLTRYNTREGMKYSIIVGIDGYRSLAARTGLHAGTEDAKFDVMPDGSYKTAAELIAAGKKPVSATVTVYKVLSSGLRASFSHTAVLSEFQGQQKWQSMPFQMLAKVAEAFALRKAFPDELAGLSITEEEHAYTDTQQDQPDAEILQLIAGCQTVDELGALYKRTKNAVKFIEQFTARKNELSQLNIIT
jgi:phage recombination protein Bet